MDMLYDRPNQLRLIEQENVPIVNIQTIYSNLVSFW